MTECFVQYHHTTSPPSTTMGRMKWCNDHGHGHGSWVTKDDPFPSLMDTPNFWNVAAPLQCVAERQSIITRVLSSMSTADNRPSTTTIRSRPSIMTSHTEWRHQRKVLISAVAWVTFLGDSTKLQPSRSVGLYFSSMDLTYGFCRIMCKWWHGYSATGSRPTWLVVIESPHWSARWLSSSDNK